MQVIAKLYIMLVDC